MLELYSLVRSVNILLENLQGNSATSGPSFVLRIAQLLQNELSLEQPLLVVSPAVVAGKDEPEASEEGEVGREAGEGGSGDKLPRGHTLVAADKLTAIGRESRSKLRTGVIKSFVLNRYLSMGDFTEVSYVPRGLPGLFGNGGVKLHRVHTR